MKHLIFAGILVVVVAAVLIVGLDYVQLFPDPASAQAEPIDSMFNLEFKIIAFLFALIVVLMVYSIVFFRRKKGDTSDAKHIEGNTSLEVLWTLIPLATVLILAYLGGQSLAETLRQDPRPVQIEAIGQQWSWRFEYPEFGVISNELVMPVDKQAQIQLRSSDVIHSFWVPEFRVKQDALPGGEQFARNILITPTREGEYSMLCAELCGEQHSYMVAPVRVLSQDAYLDWLSEESGVPNDPIVRGQLWSERFGCVSCHSADGAKSVGPTWQGLYEMERLLTDGTIVLADTGYLKESIVDPNANIVDGFPPGVMPPNFGQELTIDQIADIIEYIKTLK
jgi:cytochrome c oxidase subunit 2